MSECKAMSTPAEVGTALRRDDGPLLDRAGKELYMEITGSLLYLSSNTRPDIAYAVGVLTRFMAAPTVVHLKAANHVLRYLAGTRDIGICYKGRGEPLLEAFCDADHAGDLDTRRSTTGILFILNGGAVSWKVEIQPRVADSSGMGEYLASFMAAKEALHLRKLLPDLGHSIDGPIMIWNDNRACISMLQNPMIGGERIKHIDIKYHFVRETIHETRELDYKWISTDMMAADCLTKPVTAAVLTRCMKQMGLRKPWGT